jgi:high affinity Mn2+ porin
MILPYDAKPARMEFSERTTVTFDYQLITNPAYNPDRGPVSVFSGRLHAEF